MWCRSCVESVPVSGAADTITNPIVMAVRCRRGINAVSPRGTLSKITAPSNRGTWKVSNPKSQPQDGVRERPDEPEPRRHLRTVSRSAREGRRVS